MNCTYGRRSGSRGRRHAEDQEAVDCSASSAGKQEEHGPGSAEHSAEHAYNPSGANWTVSEPK